jgi:hypothetical protein
LTHSDPPLHRADYSNVKFWTQQDWNLFSKGKGTFDIYGLGPTERGRSWAAQGMNVTMRYIKDEHGQIIDGHRVGEMCKIAHSVWVALANAGKAPTKWSQADIVSAEAYRHEMWQHFPELHLCKNNWKADLIASKNYPSWYTHQSSQTKHSVKQEDAETSSCVSQASQTAKQPQLHNDQSSCNAKKTQHKSANAKITTTMDVDAIPLEATVTVSSVTERKMPSESVVPGTTATTGENSVMSVGGAIAVPSVTGKEATHSLKVCTVSLDILCT